MKLSAMKNKLKSKKYREAFVREHITQGIAFQIRATREERGWSQNELGAKAEMKQVLISRYEDPDYGKYTLRTLMKLANAFDVALVVRFAPFDQLAGWVSEMTSADLAVPRFDQDEQQRISVNLQSEGTESTEIRVSVADSGAGAKILAFPNGAPIFRAQTNMTTDETSHVSSEATHVS